MPEIRVKVKNVYGRDLIYCLNEFINNLTGKKTLDKRDIENLKKLGFTIKQIVPEL